MSEVKRIRYEASDAFVVLLVLLAILGSCTVCKVSGDAVTAVKHCSAVCKEVVP